MQSGELWESVLDLLREEDRLQEMASAMSARGRPGAADQIARELLDLAEQGDNGEFEAREIETGEADARG